MAKRDYRKGAIKYPFIAFPKQVLASSEWRQLSHRGRSLLLDLCGQYTGKNNGRFCPSFEVMKRYGWGSKSNLARAKGELLDTSFVVLTRRGRAPRTAEWVGLTWWQLDYHESMEIAPTEWPYMNFVDLRDALIDPNIGRGKLNGTANSVPHRRGNDPPKPCSGPPPVGQ